MALWAPGAVENGRCTYTVAVAVVFRDEIGYPIIGGSIPRGEAGSIPDHGSNKRE
jgi:hypothetical protein